MPAATGTTWNQNARGDSRITTTEGLPGVIFRVMTVLPTVTDTPAWPRTRGVTLLRAKVFISDLCVEKTRRSILEIFSQGTVDGNIFGMQPVPLGMHPR